MSIEQIKLEALRLPAEQRAQLAGFLWEGLKDPFKAQAQLDDAAALALAVERNRKIENGQVQPVSHEEIMSRLRR